MPENEGKPIPIRVLNIIFLCFLAFGLVIVFVFGASASKKATILLWMMLFLLFGVFVGFLFGIPKVLQATEPNPASNYRQLVNTNLTEISDWLTKIMVGLGLVHLTRIHAEIAKVASILAAALSLPTAEKSSLGFAFGYGIVITYALLGFLYGYIMTRLFLAVAFVTADTAALERKTEIIARQTEAIAKQTDEATAAARSAINKAEFALAKPQTEVSAGGSEVSVIMNQLITDYNNTRNTMPVGDLRTSAMTAVVRKMVDTIQDLSAIPVQEYLKDADDGKRLAAYAALYAKPEGSFIEPLIEALATDNKAFNQYWAIQAIGMVMANNSGIKPSAEAMEKLKTYYQSLQDGWDRKYELRKIFPDLKS